MKHIYNITLFLCLCLSIASCRQDSDVLDSYGGAVNTSLFTSKGYADQFQKVWTALNCNYPCWAIETIDWDAVYDKYYPQFKQYDNDSTVLSKSDFADIYTEILGPLHDGHSDFVIRNIPLYNKNGDSRESDFEILPQDLRIKQRKDYKVDVPQGTINYYGDKEKNVPAGEQFTVTTADNTYLSVIDSCITKGRENSDALLATYEKAGDSTSDGYKAAVKDTANLNILRNYYNKNKSDIDKYKNILTTYNDACTTIPSARMKTLTTSYDEGFYITVAWSADGITYFRINECELSKYIEAAEKDPEGKTDDGVIAYNIAKTWKAWYDKTQQLHQQGKLKGVIIDMRGNTGGMTDDYERILGTMLPADRYTVGTYVTKCGPGRLDYSPEQPLEMPTLTDGHATITEPIIALCDWNTISMGETTTISVKQLPNGTVVGSQTHGGLNYLLEDPGDYGDANYTGIVGQMKNGEPVGGFYARMPCTLNYYNEYGALEGVGVTPDVQVYFDAFTNDFVGSDNQLEKALDILRGK